MFSKTIKGKTVSYKTPLRSNLENQTPKLIGLSKLVSFMTNTHLDVVH